MPDTKLVGRAQARILVRQHLEGSGREHTVWDVFLPPTVVRRSDPHGFSFATATASRNASACSSRSLSRSLRSHTPEHKPRLRSLRLGAVAG